ncbi:MAG: AbrB/MazE/SpoVT family DNA-binding domain-containing protein [Bacteroidales bacterium]
MEVSIIKIGNSKGVIIPSRFLKKIGAQSKVKMEEKEGGLFLKPIRKPREGWEEAAKAAHKEGEEEMLFPDVFDDEEMEDWTW